MLETEERISRLLKVNLLLCSGLGRFRYSVTVFVKASQPEDSLGTFSVFESNFHQLLPV